MDSDLREYVANAVGIAALELSVLSCGVIVVTLGVDAEKIASAAIPITLGTAVLYAAYGFFCRHIDRDDGTPGFVGALICITVCAGWLLVLS